MTEHEMKAAEAEYNLAIDEACEHGNVDSAQRCFDAYRNARNQYCASEPSTRAEVVARLDRIIKEGCDQDLYSNLRPIRPTLVEVRYRLSVKKSAKKAAASLWRALQVAELFDGDPEYIRLLFGCIKRLERPGLAYN